ncbi:MAG: hypothetical protein KJP27_04920 [Altererythrobacter sp.]|nr:hypothetical protein [Altererythrobacter sp.]
MPNPSMPHRFAMSIMRQDGAGVDKYLLYVVQAYDKRTGPSDLSCNPEQKQRSRSKMDIQALILVNLTKSVGGQWQQTSEDAYYEAHANPPWLLERFTLRLKRWHGFGHWKYWIKPGTAIPSKAGKV